MKTLIRIVAFCAIILTGCSDEKDNKAGIVLPAASDTTLTTSNPALLSATPTTGSDAGVALNPKHGEPGHRCDIAVGAPLNSPNTANTQVIAPSTTTAAVPVTTANTTNTKLNPKHGEPGHRCDIAVGAPLDGKAQ